MYKMDKNIGKGKSFEKAENDKIFGPAVSSSERLSQAWHLTCMAYGIDPMNPPKMEKNISSTRKHSL